MKAIVLKKTGAEEKFSHLFDLENISDPEISDEEVLVKIQSVSLNHRDLYIAEGAYSNIRLPVILGSDGAGEIVLTGDKAVNFIQGDNVIIYPCDDWGNDEEFQNRKIRILGMPENGTFAEYIKVHFRNVFKYPKHLNHEQAASIPLAGLTAFRALFTKGKIKKEDNVLITGAGGGVSSFAIIFALNIGANVFVTSGSGSKIEKAISLGVKCGVNYKNENWHKELQSFSGNKIDVVIDGTGGNNYSKLIDICSYGARIISYGATLGAADKLDLHKVFWKQLKILGTTVGTYKDFKEMLNFIDLNKITPIIDKVFPFENYLSAFDRMKNSEQFGKIILNLN